MIFDVTFAPDCRADTIVFNNAFDASYDYQITTPPTALSLDPQMVQSTANCPITCTLDTQGIEDDALTFDSATGALIVTQGNFLVDATSTQITVTCESTLSESADATESQTFIMNYDDECRIADFVLDPITPQMSTFVWPTPADLKPFTAVTSNINCAPYTYSIIADPSIMSGLSIN